ncbi:hypothetical protein [Streptomyces sp. NPDC058964]|uniref:RipA family octameric membrane protein n=1 Tax=Streptomyces sp. NPDC058964 TaxID=3346681 RepID=UPI0036A56AD2
MVILEQYKLCLEMADWVSLRRCLTAAFFLTLNTTVFVAIDTFWRDGSVARAVLDALFPVWHKHNKPHQSSHYLPQAADTATTPT